MYEEKTVGGVVDASCSSSDGKQYSFVVLPGNAVKKRDEIERRTTSYIPIFV
jgi:hypothetical protein